MKNKKIYINIDFRIHKFILKKNDRDVLDK